MRDILADPTPEQLQRYAKLEAERQGVDPATIEAMFRQESQFNTNARSPKGAFGPAQLMEKTARGLGVNRDDPYDNIRGGITYYKQQLERFKDPELARAAYNAGPEVVARYGGIPPYPETQDYVERTRPTASQAPQAAPAMRDVLAGIPEPQTGATGSWGPGATGIISPRTADEEALHQLGRMARMGLSGATGTAGMIADVPARLARVAGFVAPPAEAGLRQTLQNMPLPSEAMQRGLTQLGLPEDVTTAEKVSGFLGSALAGGYLDPASKLLAAKTPIRRLTEKDLAIKQGMAAGMKVTPGQADAGPISRTAEFLAGSPTMKKMAQFANIGQADAIVRAELRLPPETPLTEGVLSNLRADIFDTAYKPLQNFGNFTAFKAFRNKLDDIADRYTSANFKTEADNEVRKVIDTYKKNPFWDSETIIRDLALVRGQADEAFRQGSTLSGKMRKEVADAIEANIEANLSKNGPSRILADFRAGREQMAKTYDVGDIIDEGSVNLQKLAEKGRKREPLTGNLKMLSDFARAAPGNIGKPSMERPPPLNMPDVLWGLGASNLLTPAYAGVALGRAGTRYGMLTSPYQRALISPRISQTAKLFSQPEVQRALPSIFQGLFRENEQ